jgi:hypothetical protein
MTNSLSAPSFKFPLLLLLLLAPGVGLAGQQAPATLLSPRSTPSFEALPRVASSSLPDTALRVPLRLSGNSGDQEGAEPPRPSRALRILAETGAGLLTGGAGGVAGYLIGTRLCQLGIVGSNGGWFPCLGEGIVGFVMGFGTGFPLGVFWGGEAAGGDGMLLGVLAGPGVGLVMNLLLTAITRSPSTGFALSIPFLAIGSIVGYELSQRRTEPPAMASARLRIQPVLALSSRGTLVGLGGSF